MNLEACQNFFAKQIAEDAEKLNKVKDEKDIGPQVHFLCEQLRFNTQQIMHQWKMYNQKWERLLATELKEQKIEQAQQTKSMIAHLGKRYKSYLILSNFSRKFNTST